MDRVDLQAEHVWKRDRERVEESTIHRLLSSSNTGFILLKVKLLIVEEKGQYYNQALFDCLIKIQWGT